MSKALPNPDTSAKIAAVFAPIKSNDRAANTNHKRLGVRRIILLVGFIIVLTLLGTGAVTMLSNHGETSTTNQVKSVFSGDQMREYNSPDNNFTINFPGFPTVDKASNKAGDKTVAITTYQRLIDNNSKNYTLAVYDYTGLELDGDKALESALNSSLQNTPGAKVQSTQKGVYGKYKAIEAAYTVTDKQNTYDAHIRYILKDSKMYSVIVIGGDKAKFDEFANSLKLT